MVREFTFKHERPFDLKKKKKKRKMTVILYLDADKY